MPTTYAIPDGRVAMAATTYTGNGGTQAILNAVNGVSFQPDFVWLKTRSTSQNHSLIDSVRGNTKILYSDLTNAENTFSGVLDSFNSNGFTLGSSASVNQNGTTFVGWQWKAGGTAVSNTAGSITSSVSANPTAGFSVVTFTGNGSNPATVGHGLGAAPTMIIFKRRNSAVNWFVYAGAAGNGAFEGLNTTAAYSSGSTVFNSTAPTSTVFSLGNVDGNASGGTYVAYCFAPVAGYSAFGKYTGNGSADGPFVYLGFRPKFILWKNASSTYSWYIVDTTRWTYNAMSGTLAPNTSSAEDTAWGAGIFDILSNGFKVRTSSAETNASGGTFIYMAFAENPFKYANAR